MTDPAAVERDAAEAASAFSHPAVTPDATAAYGEHPDHVIDFYAPRGETPGGPVPLVVVLHGGAWRAPYDRQHITPFADFLARRGFAVANVEYRRGSSLPHQNAEGPVAGRWPETFDDVAAAMDALPGLAATALPPVLRGVVALAPIADFAVAEELGVCGGASAQLLGGERYFADRLPYADPAALLPTGIATAVVQGRDDIVVPQQVAEAYVAAAAKAGEMVGLTLLDGVGHFPLIDPAADACAVVAEEISQLAW